MESWSLPGSHRALYALLQGQLDQALTLARTALSLRETAQFKPYLPLDHLLLRDIYQARGDTTNAKKHTALAQEIGYPNLIASAPDRNTITNINQENPEMPA